MKNIFIITRAALLCFMLACSVSAKAEQFELIKQDNDISLYERWIPGKNGEKVRELKTVLAVDASIRSVVTLLMDNHNGIRWNAHADIYRVLPAGGQYRWITYIRYGMPWPFNDQDCCLSYHLTVQGRKQTLIAFKSATDSRCPMSAKTDRITGVRGTWLLEESGSSGTKITYTITTDRSKKVPRWVSDPVVHNNLFSTMSAFKKLVEKAG